MFLYGDSLVGECSRWLRAQVQILFTILLYKNTLGLVIDHSGYSAFRAADLSVFLYGSIAQR